MVDLERHAFKRDKRFLVRLIVFLIIGAAFGAFLFVKITSPEVGTCVAGGFGDATDGEGKAGGETGD